MSKMNISRNLTAVRRPFQAGCKRLSLSLRRIAAQGLTPRPLAKAIAIGVTVGLLPTIWGTSIVCLGLTSLFRLNHIVVQTTNYLIYPIQITLFIPFSTLGRQLLPSWFGSTPSLSLATRQFHWPDLNEVLIATQLSALAGWLLAAPFILATIYTATYLIRKQLFNHSQTNATS